MSNFSYMAEFGYIPKDIDKGKLIDSWRRMTSKYDRSPISGSRRAMLDVLHFDNTLDPNNLHLLQKDVTMPNGLPGKVYTGAMHTNVDKHNKILNIHTIAGNPQSVRKPMYKGAVDSAGDWIEQFPDDYTLSIDTIPSTKPIYGKKLGYIDNMDNTVRSTRLWRKHKPLN